MKVFSSKDMHAYKHTNWEEKAKEITHSSVPTCFLVSPILEDILPINISSDEWETTKQACRDERVIFFLS